LKAKQPDTLPRPPHLTGDAAWLWDHIVAQEQAGGLVKPIDSAGLEIVCETFARFRDAAKKRREHGALSKNSQGVVIAPWVQIETQAAAAFKSWCAEYGLTPLSRGAFDNLTEGAPPVVSTLDELKKKREARRSGTA
jgi:P27 family predicted phage terminase small subunit